MGAKTHPPRKAAALRQAYAVKRSAPLPLTDRAWFAANPHREFRLRPLFPGELLPVREDLIAPPGWEVWAISWRLAPGVRAKHSVCVNPEIAADAMGCESLVHAMHELLVAHPKGKEMVTTHQVVELAEKYAMEAALDLMEVPPGPDQSIH